MKIKDIEDKAPDHSVYITSNSNNKFSGTVFDERLKQAKVATNKGLDTFEQRAVETKERMKNGKLLT